MTVKRGMCKLLILFAVSAAATFLILKLFILTAEAGEGTASAECRSDYGKTYYTSVKISAEDTLETIADRYNCGFSQSNSDYIQEIRQVNHMPGERLHPGCYLTVKYRTGLNREASGRT